MSSNAQLAVQNRYARCPIASPSVKYSNRASSVTNPTASAKIAVDPHNTIPTTNGINTTAVATRFQVIEMESPRNRGLHLITLREINHARDVLCGAPEQFFCHPSVALPMGLQSEGFALREKPKRVSETTRLRQRSRISL